MPSEFVMLPPHTDKTREWGAALAAALPEMKIIVAENHTHAAGVIAHADAAFGTIPPDLLREAKRLRWLQAPQAAPPAGYYYPELVAHPARDIVVGNSNFFLLVPVLVAIGRSLLGCCAKTLAR